MNERIQQLIQQATVRTDDPNELVQRLELNPELLVKLVVKDCIAEIREREIDNFELRVILTHLRDKYGSEVLK